MRYRRCILIAAALALLAPMASQAQQGRRGMSAERRAQMAVQQAQALLADMQTERPIEALNSVWIEELTWMEVRDALRDRLPGWNASVARASHRLRPGSHPRSPDHWH